MIILHKLKWGNCFSYAEDNEVQLDRYPITQLVGINGAGKTSIPILIQEVLFGKNIKGIKKQDISNRYTDTPGYWIELLFSKYEDSYVVKLNRSKTKLTLSLYENGEDISSHTSVATYKSISNILGFSDFKMVSQLLYQSSTTNLEFLTATDTNRKKFLVSLLNLEKYLDINEKFKQASKDVNRDIIAATATLEQITAWISKHNKMDFDKKDLKPTKTVPEELRNKLHEIQSNIKDIKAINKKIVMNNTYISDMQSLDTSILSKTLPAYNKAKVDAINEDIGGIRAVSNVAGKTKSRFSTLEGLNTCPTCFKEVDASSISDIIENSNNEIHKCSLKIKELQSELKKWEFIREDERFKSKTEQEFIRLNRLIDNNLSKDTLDEGELSRELLKVTNDIHKIELEIKSINKANVEIAAHNAEIDVVAKQLEDFKLSEVKKRKSLDMSNEEKTYIDILKNAFSTNGLLSYKIESSVKVLEDSINQYLSEFCFFRIEFSLNGEKLNVNIIDDSGELIAIESLSTGELARVNISTVLAIRKVMTTLSSSNINFLFLDEIVGVLDEAGKEKLTEILIRENLNTFIVSHESTHPLIPKILVEKENNISRLTDG